MVATTVSSKELERGNSWVQPSPTVEHACEYLSELYGRVRFFNLYQKLFPAEYATSTASSSRPEGRYSEKEEEFLNLVKGNLFELPEMAFDPAFGTDALWVAAMGVQPGCSCGSPHAENYAHVWQIAMALTGIAEGDDLDITPDLREALTDLQYAGRPERDMLQNLLEEHIGDDLHETGHPQDAPIRHFGLLVDVVCADTGNIFYDVDNTEDNDFIWDEENIKLFTEHWKETPAIEAKLDEFILWFNTDEEKITRALVSIWNKLGNAGQVDLIEDMFWEEMPEDPSYNPDQYEELANE